VQQIVRRPSESRTRGGRSCRRRRRAMDVWAGDRFLWRLLCPL